MPPGLGALDGHRGAGRARSTVADYDQRRREYLACGWLPPKWDWVDPLKDARAEIEQIDAGLKSRTQALAERGYDAEQVDAEIAADKAREKSLGLILAVRRSTPPQASVFARGRSLIGRHRRPSEAEAA